jgi:hypothetical protein
MPEETNNQEQTKQRTEIKDLPQSEQELSAEEQKNVKGGVVPMDQRTISSTDYRTAVPTDYGTIAPPDTKTR